MAKMYGVLHYSVRNYFFKRHMKICEPTLVSRRHGNSKLCFSASVGKNSRGGEKMNVVVSSDRNVYCISNMHWVNSNNSGVPSFPLKYFGRIMSDGGIQPDFILEFYSLCPEIVLAITLDQKLLIQRPAASVFFRNKSSRSCFRRRNRAN